MNNPAINPILSAPTMAPPAKQPEASQPETSFDNVLKREVADRGNADKDNAAKPQETANATPPAPAKAAQKTDDKQKAAQGDDDKTTDATDQAAATPEEMLALFANVGQIAVAPEARDKAVAADPKSAKPVLEAKLDKLAAARPVDTKEAGKSIEKTDGASQGFNAELKAAADKGAPVSADSGKLSDNANSSGKSQKDLAIEDAGKADTANTAHDTKAVTDRTAMAGKNGQNDGVSAAATDTRHASTLADVQAAPQVASVAPLQHAAMNGIHAAVGQGDRLAPQVGSPGWDRALAQKVVWMVAGDQQSASITLNPPDLGPLQVVLNVSNSQATVSFSAAQPEVRQALVLAIPKLREMMGDAGIQLGQATVGAGTPQQNQNPDERSAKNASFGTPVNEVAETAVQVPRSRGISSGQGMVDTFV